jgi:hypothetical protein
VVGEVSTRIMKGYPESRLAVLCGHEIQVLDNLRVLIGEARYGQPKAESVLKIK